MRRDAFWESLLVYGGLVMYIVYEIAKSQHLF